MRFVFILAAVLFRFALFAHTQRTYEGPHPEPEKDPDPAPNNKPGGGTNEPSQYSGEAPGVPGALAEGQSSEPAPEDDEIDFDDIADALKEVVEKIIDAVDDSQGATQSTAAPTLTQGPIPTSAAAPCTDALDAYSSCSTAYNGTFSAIARTVQAGCLCNASPGFDFNGEMGKCYSYAQNQTQLQSYASVIASATAACTPTNSPAATTASTSTGGGSGGDTSPSNPSSASRAVTRSLRPWLGLVVGVTVFVFMSILY